ncbi:MAG: ComEC/Rec2 family competence protein [Prolixibacteraceae bacterium]|nr:ComEC/Rec2 family competence protein [Prolixibacteraceae bacterium]
MDKTVQKTPFLRLLLALVTGILLGSKINADIFLCIVLILALIILLTFLNHHFTYKLSLFFGAGIHLVYIILGILIVRVYTRQPGLHTGGVFVATVLEIPGEKPNSFQSLLRTEAFYRNDSLFRTNEKVMARFRKSDPAGKLVPGQRILFSSSPRPVEIKNNPFEFDYKKYLRRKKIYRQVWLEPGSWELTSLPVSSSPVVAAERFRMHLVQIFRNLDPGKEESEILPALTLGFKRGLEPETKEIFASAGAMHVLAVSGLHTGIVFFTLSFCFGFLKKTKAGRVAYLIIIICSIWFYAFLTGLSPSVSRAAMMVSFVVTGEALKRQRNIYNTLAASAFILLLINPGNLYDAGFQLSYSAVFGIVFLQPRLATLINCRFTLVRYFLVLLTVSVSAQITTFPFSVFYFSQFPVYFWITNLIVIPVISILAPLGFLLLIFNGISVVTSILTLIIHYLTQTLFAAFKIINSLPFSVLKFSFTTTETIFFILLILSLFALTATRKFVFVKTALFLLLCILSLSLAKKTVRLFRREIIVYNYPENLIIHLIKGDTNYVISAGSPDKNSYAGEMIMNTVTGLGTGKPLFLTSGKKYRDDHLWMERGVISFGGRIFQLSREGEHLPAELCPEIIIGSLPPAAGSTGKPEIRYITNDNKPGREISDELKIHFLKEKGAYRENW